ncbi:carbohydrate-binding module family 48 protein [Myriangium duriaei CBS 260.36]|uniref:Carbohydrate-binding module family 48 protein n=1 Tax=Myriangium duriaei CBS 260.36 TaxID=1168546 RepID=A0A9P4J9V5_9PEZI|nr:carbohydrate-binding module family 48 protein [Myriangium duriaei CBS 260.36]
MGNSPSVSQKQTPPSTQRDRDRDHHHPPRTSNDVAQRREPKRRESVHALPSTASKATPAPPSASLESAVGQPIPTSVSTSPVHTRDSAKSSTHSRNRSATIPTPHLRSNDKTAMGNESSKPAQASTAPSSNAPTPTIPQVQASSPVTRPIDAPTEKGKAAAFEPSPLDPTAPLSEAYNLPSASFSRPPRLPLPIEEEEHKPGSPLGDKPEDDTAAIPPLEINETESQVQRKNSVISSNADDEEEPDEFLGPAPEAGANVPRVPTLLEWRDAKPGDKVYVTGTFTNWERKFRLYWDGPSKHANTLSSTLVLPPGTHHLKFLVNNDMQVSPNLPTTVDFTNILVNYIEVVLPPVAPVAVPGVATKPMEIRNKQTTDASSPVRTTSPAVRTTGSTASPSAAGAKSSPKPNKTPQVTIKKGPPKQYTSQIPPYLLDLDTWPPPTDSPDSSADESSAAQKYHRANAAANAQPEPPSLPLFLNKSILNSATPTKDDSSVLVLPNHTVLNHLSTTSIRAGVLASSCTCRYKQRFLTTIFYRPRGEDAE